MQVDDPLGLDGTIKWKSFSAAVPEARWDLRKDHGTPGSAMEEGLGILSAPGPVPVYIYIYICCYYYYYYYY